MEAAVELSPGVTVPSKSENPDLLAGGLTLTDAVGDSVRNVSVLKGNALDVICRDSGGGGGAVAA